MKLKYKLRLILGIVGFVTLSPIVYFLIATFLQHWDLRKINYRDRVSDYIKRTISPMNASYHYKMNEDSIVIYPEFPNTLLSSKILMVVIVMTNPENEVQRRTIRDTWKKFEYETDCLVYFYMNKPSDVQMMDKLREESIVNNDMIVDNQIYEDGPMQIIHPQAHSSIRALRLLNWYHIHFMELSQFLIKTNDETFVNVQNLQKYLIGLKYSEIKNGFIAGNVPEEYETRIVQSEDPYSRRFVPKELWNSGSYFPEYIDEQFTIFSSRIIPQILEVSGTIPLFHLDDIFITGMIVKGTLHLNFTELPNSKGDCYSTLPLPLLFWWNNNKERETLQDAIVLKCPDSWYMTRAFSPHKDRLLKLQNLYMQTEV